MPSNHKKSNNGDKILQLTKNQLEDLVHKMVQEATKPLQSEIIDLKTEIAQLRESQEFLSGQHDSLNKNYDNAVKVNDKQRQEIRKLNQCTNDLKKQRNNEELKVDELEQYDRIQNLIFEGVPQFQNDNVTEIILSLASKLDVNLTANDISIAHRLPVKRPRLNSESNVTDRRHPGIIVRFISRQKRNDMYLNRMKAKDISDFPVQGMNKLYVNENLTQLRKRLFWLAKQKAKELDYNFIWTSNGQIIIREDKKADSLPIRTEYDLDNLLLNCGPMFVVIVYCYVL